MAPMLRALLSCLAMAGALLAGGCGSPSPAASPPSCPCDSPAPEAKAAPPPPSAAPRVEAYDLPTAGGLPSLKPQGDGPDTAETPVLAVDIAANGSLMVNGQRVEADGLQRVARETFARDPRVRAVIRADRATPWGLVVLAMDHIKSAGIGKLAFAVSAGPG